MTETGRRFRWQYSMRDLFIAVAVVAVAMPLVVPWLVAARERSRDGRCRDNLRLFYSGFSQHADKDPRTRFSTGGYDFANNGCPDTHGWVADLVRNGVCLPQDHRCPANPAQGTETLNDLLGATPIYTEADPFTLEDGFCKQLGHARLVAGAPGVTQFVMDAIPSEAEQLVADELLAKGYGTNYAATWFFTCTQPRLDVRRDQSPPEVFVSPAHHVKTRLTAYRTATHTLGPVTRDIVQMSHIATNCIPLISDGNVRAAGVTKLIGNLRSSARSSLSIGDPLAITTSEGPANAEVTDSGLTYFGESEILIKSTHVTPEVDIFHEEQPSRGGTPKFRWLQDYRSFGPVHQDGGVRYCNVLFADGSVRPLHDSNDDGNLNSGFGTSKVRAPTAGFNDSAVELAPETVFSGLFLQKVVRKSPPMMD